jgi:hypothetical protein
LIKSLFISALRKRGFTLHKYEWGAHFDAELFDVEPEFRPVAEKFKTRDILRQYAAWKAARYVATCGVPGDVVECGVLHGKSATAVTVDVIDFQTKRSATDNMMQINKTVSPRAFVSAQINF